MTESGEPGEKVTFRKTDGGGRRPEEAGGGGGRGEEAETRGEGVRLHRLDDASTTQSISGVCLLFLALTAAHLGSTGIHWDLWGSVGIHWDRQGHVGSLGAIECRLVDQLRRVG